MRSCLWLVVGFTACGEEVLPSLTDSPCVVRGFEVELDGVTVPASDGTTVRVSLDRAPASALITDGAGETELRVDGALTFTGYVTRDVTYHLAAAVETADGMVHLAPGASLIEAHLAAGGVVGTVQIDREVIGQAFLTPVTVPCEALSLDEQGDWLDLGSTFPTDGTWWRQRVSPACERMVDGYDENEDEETPAGDEATESEDEDIFWWTADEVHRAWSETELNAWPCATRLTLTSRPGGGTLVVLHESETAMFARVKQQGDFVQVVAERALGAVVGWVARAELEQVEEPYGFGIGGWGSSIGCCGFHYGGPWPPTYEGPAEIEPGTAVSTSSGGVWATAMRGGSFEVRHVRGEATVQLLAIPGLARGCGRTWEAHVPRSAVVLPPGASYE